ncbi:MAG: DUF4956 domain-containing protein [Eubacteriales bacterium]|nr:DUF4956 domain-containing protein [Eubacteriales bacterium]
MFNPIWSGRIDASSFAICMIVGIILGILTSLCFQYRNRQSSSFSLTLALLPTTVAVIIMLVNGNIGTGVAVAGAFALIRFRSVAGKARDIIAIFVSMTMGLALGMGYVSLSIVFFVIVAICTLVLVSIDFGHNDERSKIVKIVIPENLNYEHAFDDIFEKYTKYHKLEKVRTTNMGTLFELTFDILFKQKEISKEFIDEIRVRNGNLNIIVGEISEEEIL